MHLSKLVSVLKSFDEPTLKRLREYVRSDYFNVPKSAIELFSYMEKYYPDFKESKIQPEVITGKVPNLSSASKQAKAGTELLKSIENFLAVEDCQQNERNRDMHRLAGLKKLHLFEQFDKDFQRTFDDLEACTEQNVETFYYKHQLTELKLSAFNAKLERNRQNDLAPLVRSLDEFYAVKKLYYLCEAINRKQVFGIDYNGQHVQLMLETLKPYDNERYPFVHLFINVFRMLTATSYAESEAPYLVIKQAAIKYDKSELSGSLADSINYALNRCLLWSAHGFDEAGKEYLWWIEFKMKWGRLLENDKITPITFRNVVSSATLYGRNPDWTRQFIRAYSQNLPADSRDENVAFALGLYYYAIKDYASAIRYFLNAQAKDEVVFNAIIRRWQWMATYEANPEERDLLINQLMAFEKYLLRNKEEFNHYKAPFTHFINYSKKLISGNNKLEQAGVLDELSAHPHFPGKSWIIEQLSRLTQKVRSFDERTFV